MVNSAFAVLTVVSIASVLWLFPATPQQKSNITAEKQIEEQAQQTDYPQLNFSISLLNLLQKDEPNESIFYSPYSVYRLLLLVYFGAGGDTENELKTVLGLTKSKENVHHAYNLEKIQQAKRFKDLQIEFTWAEKIYVSKHIKIS